MSQRALVCLLAACQGCFESWRREYNEERPKKSLGGLPPAIYAATLKRKDVKLTPDSKAKCY
ncbi:transposase [Comamonas sp. EJ-4]|uniref:Transposase n=1 Tax=Comamonas suwonensis TaxID=2606214 RepID=A0A843B6N5_9BURK|nr:transposase [Comamonas suwonensis]